MLISQKTTSANVVAAQSAALQQVCLSRGCIFWFPAHLTALFPMSTFRRLQLEVDGMRTSWRASRGAHQRCRRFLHQISSVPVTVFRIKEMEPRESNHGIWHALYRSMYIYVYGCTVGVEVEGSQWVFLFHLSFNPLEEPLFKPQ